MKLFTWIGWTAATLLCMEVALMALRYLLPGFSGPAFIVHNSMAHPWLYVHAGFGAVALLIGLVQFAPAVRARTPRLHRWMGRTYLVSCLMSGAAGLLLACGTAAGPAAAVGFGLAAAISLACAVQAWRFAMARQFDEHRRWVFRSYALIFAAVTLRIWLPASQFAHLDFMTSYRAIAFLAWVPNLLVVELYLASGRPSRRTSAVALGA